MFEFVACRLCKRSVGLPRSEQDCRNRGRLQIEGTFTSFDFEVDGVVVIPAVTG